MPSGLALCRDCRWELAGPWLHLRGIPPSRIEYATTATGCGHKVCDRSRSVADVRSSHRNMLGDPLGFRETVRRSVAVVRLLRHHGAMARRERGLWAVTVGSVVCPECGADPVETHRPGGWERFRYRLTSGGPAPTTMTCEQGHRWSGGSSGMLLYRGRSGRWRWLHLPLELFRVVRRERSMVPVPLTYLMATVVGVGLGVIADLVLGWPWWLVAAGFVAAVWVFFLASALWGPGRPLSDDLWMVIDPVRAEDRQFQRLAGAVTDGEVVCFEVEGWAGSRSLGGWGGGKRPERITLRHGDPDRDELWVQVTSCIGRDAQMAVRRDRVGHELPRLGQVVPPDGLDAHELHRWHMRQRQDLEQLPPPTWSHGVILVDGQTQRCEVARADERWAAITAHGNVSVEIIGSGIDMASITLQRLTTLEHYFRGSRSHGTRHPEAKDD